MAEPLGGETWEDVSIRNVNNINSVIYQLGIFVLMGNSGTSYTSPDGETFLSGGMTTPESFHAVTFHVNNFVGVGSNGIFRQSFDGRTWFGGVL